MTTFEWIIVTMLVVLAISLILLWISNYERQQEIRELKRNARIASSDQYNDYLKFHERMDKAEARLNALGTAAGLRWVEPDDKGHWEQAQ